MEKLFILGNIFSILSLSFSMPNISSEILAKENSLTSLKSQCESICSEAKGKGKIDEGSVICCCEVAKTASEVLLSSLIKKAKDVGITLQLDKTAAKREINTMHLNDLPHSEEDEVDSVRFVVARSIPKALNKRLASPIQEGTKNNLVDVPEGTVKQEAPLNIPERQKAVNSTKGEGTNSEHLEEFDQSQSEGGKKSKAPTIINKKTITPEHQHQSKSPKENGEAHDGSQPAESKISKVPKVISEGQRGLNATELGRQEDFEDLQPPEGKKFKVPNVTSKTSKNSTDLEQPEDFENSENNKKPKAPKIINKKPTEPPTAEDSAGTSVDVPEDIVGEGAPHHRTIRRSTPSPRRASTPRRTFSSEATKAILESAKLRLSGLIERTHQAAFHSASIGADIDAICASLRPLSGKASEGARSMERAAIIEQIREREKERQARMQSRFGAHSDVPKKFKSLIVGSANPNASEKTEESQEKISKAVVVQPPELVEN